MCAIVSAARDEEAPEHAQDSKLTLAGHTLEGISIAGQVSWKVNQPASAHCSALALCSMLSVSDRYNLRYVHAYIVGNLHHPPITKPGL